MEDLGKHHETQKYYFYCSFNCSMTEKIQSQITGSHLVEGKVIHLLSKQALFLSMRRIGCCSSGATTPTQQKYKVYVKIELRD